MSFWENEIAFWGMIYGADGTRPDPEKVEALHYMTPPTNKEELVSFLCMMQSNSDFLPNFAKTSAPLRELTKSRVHFKWSANHQKCFDDLIAEFKEDMLLRYFDMAKPIFIFLDAHITGLGVTLAQGATIKSAKPVACASRTTNAAEARYSQLDLEAMALDFGCRRFRQYLVGAPSIVTLVTDHKPLCSIFNGNRKGSIRTERIKMRHQDIRFHVEFQKGTLNQSDYISRRGKPLPKVPKNEQEEADDLNNLLYILHTTPIIDKIELGRIAQQTKEDPVLSKLTALIKQGQTWIPKSEVAELRRFKEILPEITVTGNGILLKDDRIILPESLQEEAIQLAHRGSHTRLSGMERRLRFHFFFHDMRNKVEGFLKKCSLCQAFSDKRSSEPIKAHSVPSKCWDTVSVDLFGPMPSSKHVVVVQDLASRFPLAKVVSSTSAAKVIPVLADVYDSYGNPRKQISDNGPPFNSDAMKEFTAKRHIEVQKIPPLHPSANPVETFMKPLGKTMKIANYTKKSEEESLRELLSNYRDTPHPATGIAPAARLFRDGQESVFPRMTVSDEHVKESIQKDIDKKQMREDVINSSKFRQPSNISVGDTVMMRNHRKQSKFETTFLPESFKVVDVTQDGRSLVIERISNGSVFRRHPDDVKIFDGNFPPKNIYSSQKKMRFMLGMNIA